MESAHLQARGGSPPPAWLARRYRSTFSDLELRRLLRRVGGAQVARS